MAGIPKAQEIYRHFKGNLYQVLSLAEHTETGEVLVIYQAMYGDFKVYARPLSMFCSKVDREKYPQAKQEYRFELQVTWNGNQEPVIEKEVLLSEGKEEKREDHILEKTEETSASTEDTVSGEEEQEEPKLDPMLIEFLDADTYTQKLNILAGLHHRITDDMLTTMAIASDVEVEEGDLEVRYQSLKNCLLTFEKYEINRI